jgi:hydrogenase maturation protease
MRTILLGMGNPILSDDAVGVRLAADFKASSEPIPELDILEECSVGGITLLDVLRGYRRAIVLDSLQTSGGTPGTWHRFTAAALRETIHLTNVHDANFATALDLGRLIGLPLPDADEIHILAVEIQDNRTFSEQMTPALERAYPGLKAAIFKELDALLPGVARQNRGGDYLRHDLTKTAHAVNGSSRNETDRVNSSTDRRINYSCCNEL